jgi:hypothetical protein
VHTLHSLQLSNVGSVLLLQADCATVCTGCQSHGVAVTVTKKYHLYSSYEVCGQQVILGTRGISLDADPQ